MSGERAVPSQRRELAARLLAARRKPGGDAIPAVPRDAGLLECSPEQRRLWLAAQTDRQVAAPNVTLGLSLSGPLDLGALAKALAGLAERHETLRTVFVNSGGEPRQMILGTPDAPLTLVDLTGDPQAEETALRLATAAAGERFDLVSGPMLRLTVYRTAPGEHRLLLAVNHLVCDGGSLGVVARDLAALYGGRELPPPPAVTYADYAAWARSRVRAHAGGRLDHWRERLADAPPLLGGEPGLAGDAPRHPDGRLSATTALHVDTGTMDALRGGPATPFVAVLAAFSVLLHRATGASGLTVGTVTGTRARRELEPLVGCFINMVPIPLRVEGTEGFRAIVARARAEVGAALAHEVPFDTLTSAVGGRRRPGVHPVFQVALIPQDAPEPPGGWDGLRAFAWSPEVDETAYDLALAMTPTETGHRLALTHRRDRVPERVAGPLAAGFAELLGALPSAPDVPVGDLALPSLDALARPDTVAAPGAPAGDPRAGAARSAGLADEPGPGSKAARSAEPVDEPVDEEVSAEVRRIWSEVLGVPEIGADADLFDLGGDSLAITRIAARVQDSLGVEVPAWMFFETPTIGGFVEALTTFGRSSPGRR
ncbi:condensation domain-containing protein [Sphaerisporangium sp. NPDC051017]|uniref:condensation domain-containing protein n=1 Tax=Sphaerisporangium sp. NPDC051017 TaxID=3154636 RepID=UPI003417D546